MIPKVLAALCSARHPFVGRIDPSKEYENQNERKKNRKTKS